MEEKNEKKVKKRFSKLTIIRLVFLIMLVLSNTFAWFIYITRIDNSVTVHVKAWDVVFQDGEDEITSTLDLDIDDLYPGMEDYLYEISAFNRSEVAAILSYQILEVRILDDSYITVEGREALNQAPVATDLTSAQMQNKLESDYPFSISIATTSLTIDDTDGFEKYRISAEWDYEGGHDALDTTWGINAATFQSENPNTPSITLKIKVTITQDLNANNGNNEPEPEPEPDNGD